MKKLLLLLIIPLLSFGQFFLEEFYHWDYDTMMLVSYSDNFSLYPCLEDSILLIENRWDIPDSGYTDSLSYLNEDSFDSFKKIGKEILSKEIPCSPSGFL